MPFCRKTFLPFILAFCHVLKTPEYIFYYITINTFLRFFSLTKNVVLTKWFHKNVPRVENIYEGCNYISKLKTIKVR